jgi:hypothetical protein
LCRKQFRRPKQTSNRIRVNRDHANRTLSPVHSV